MYVDVAGRVPMSVTPIDLDEEALAQAMAELGTTTKKDTVNLALREVAERRSRLRAFEKLMQLGDADVGHRAWRECKDLAAHDESDTDV
jgi:Arc/MetJ family transcription regulator